VNSSRRLHQPAQPGHRRSRQLKRLNTGKFRLIQAETDDTRGHGTHTWAKFWKKDLVELLAKSEKR
jgi:hypothetical protein